MNDSRLSVLKESEKDTMKGKFLTFSLGKEFYGIDIFHVTEIIGIQPITVIPELPHFIRGIINLRGKIIPVMDARAKFSIENTEYNDRTCIVVVEVYDLPIGIIVDAVSEVMDIEDENIVPPPDIGGITQKYINNIGINGNEVILIIDCEQLLSLDEIDELQTINGSASFDKE